MKGLTLKEIARVCGGVLHNCGKELENREMELIPFRDWIEKSFGPSPKLASSHKLLCHLFS